MRVVFASHGSLGDLVPFLEIGKALAARGHTATVATHPAHRASVAAAGLGFAPMRPDRPDDPAFHARFMHPRRGPAFAYTRYLGPAVAASDADLSAAVAGADVLVSVTLALAAPIVAARTGVPWLSAAFQPAMLYSALDPPRLAMLPLVRGWPQYNARVLAYAEKGVEAWAAPLRAYRAAAGLGDYPAHPAFRGQHSPDGVLALYSPLFGPVPADAPRGTVQTGQVLQTGSPPLDPRIADFLADGEPPVVFTLGSASAHVARRFFEDSARAARRLGVRALLLAGGAGAGRDLPSDPALMVAGSAPYQAVFPHAAAVVHQGGIGTIALAMAAGVPMVAVPFSHDQPDNAARAARAGVARVVPRWRYRLSAAPILRQVLDDGGMRATSARLAPLIAAENGAERAADAIIAAAR
ncbi:glycosyltransferase [Acuticoccus sediminis]|uniref:Glycosyltransferase n=1 Tax=Acuticoccus sediminis TaxID=2184697 RepID=A0A8B2NR13_9HYPH|nr:glycosyltransferase [Acuticoccus sediminis]RAH99451.1 glycosyltransferase [Acuticoccus sediminis]